MKVKVYEFRNVNENYWVNGVTTIYADSKYTDRLITLRVDKAMFEKSVKVPVKFPLALDVKFKKGVGITALEVL